MAVSLATLRTRLESDVPARGGIPGDEQYERAVRDAVADYGRRNPLRKLTTLSIVSGTATYDLPDDFLRVITLESLTSPDGVIISAEGLIPVSATYSERYYITGTQITFDPTPTFTVSRDLWYAATYVLDDSYEYADMTEADAGIVLLKARALAKRMQADGVTAGDIIEYQVGDARVKRADLGKSLSSAAVTLEQEYLAAVAAAIGPVGMRADYNRLGR